MTDNALHDGAASDAVVSEHLAELWTNMLGTVPAADTDFFDAGGTSVYAVYLAAAIQDDFAVAVDAIEVVTLRRFDEIAALVSRRRLDTR